MSTHLRHVRWMRNRLSFQRNLLLGAEGIEVLRRHLLRTSEEMLQQLDVAELMLLATGRAARRHGLPGSFYQRYDTLIANIGHALSLATQQALVNQGRMMEARIIRADVDSRASCRICGERFPEGMVIGVLSCSHRFHRRCIVGRYATHSRCPICQRQI